MRAEREKLNAKITAGSLRMTSGQLELPAESCHIILFSGGSCTVRCGDTALLVSPGCVLLLGPGAWVVSQAGHALPEMLGCGFPLTALHEMKNATGEDFLRLFAPGSQMALYGSVQWASRLRTLLEMMRSAMGEPEYPGGLYLALTLHYVEQEHRAQSAADARPRNETVEQICAYLAANYQQKLSLTEVAARFYISPYYLSRLFRRVTGQSIVDYINARRIEAAQKLLETTELSIGSVAEQTGFASAAHFRRVFRETMGVGPLQYRKSRKWRASKASPLGRGVTEGDGGGKGVNRKYQHSDRLALTKALLIAAPAYICRRPCPLRRSRASSPKGRAFDIRNAPCILSTGRGTGGIRVCLELSEQRGRQLSL